MLVLNTLLNMAGRHEYHDGAGRSAERGGQTGK